MTRAKWINVDETIGNLIDDDTDSVIVIEPNSDMWAEFYARSDIEPFSPEQTEIVMRLTYAM